MRLNRALRMWRWTPVAALVAAAACEHGDVNRLVTVDGDTVILNISLSPGGGAPTGTRVVNRFLSTAFDTSLADAFARQKATVANFAFDPNGFYGTAAGRQLYYSPVGVTLDSFVPPSGLLPAVVNVGQFSYGALYGAPRPVAYIVPGGHAGNGAGNTSWEFWYVIRNLTPATRYVMGLARYALQVNGALDHAEMLLNGTVTQPDSLVFRAGDFTPGGNLANDNGYIVDCSDPAEGRPVDGANPHYVAGKTSSAAGTSQRIIIDHTICSDGSTVWSNGFTSAKSPVPVNNKIPGTNQYNFLVVWEAMCGTNCALAGADSTPNYAKPVWREQIAPLMTTTGQLINNAYAPLPSAGLTAAQLALLPGSTSRPDTVTITATDLPMLANGSYQVWFTKSGTDSVALATGRFDKLVNNVIVDSNLSTNSFNGDTAAATFRMRIDFGAYSTLAGFDNVVLAIAPAGGSTTALPASQPMWAGISNKLPGQAAPALSSSLAFGNFDNGGAALARWAPAGNGIGGVFGRRIDVRVFHLLRPPVGFYYNAYLRNSGDTIPIRDLGEVTSPFPDYASLRDADLNAGGTVNAVEIVESAVRAQAQTDVELCGYDKIDVRLEPKLKAPATVPRAISITGDTRYPSLERCRKPPAQ